jgi:hypothetical protein
VLENAAGGTFTVTGSESGAFYLGTQQAGGGTIKNDAGGTFDFQTASYVYCTLGTFDNAGTLEQTVTTGTTSIYAPFTNTGTVSVQTGTLQFDGNVTSSASGFTVNGGATLDFHAGTFTLSAGAIDGAGTTQLSGGTLELAANKVGVVGAFVQTGGTIDGTETLTILGPTTFSGETGNFLQETGSGTTDLVKGATDSGAIALDGGRTLKNEGTFTVTTGAGFYLGINENGGEQKGGGIIKNLGTFDIQAPATFSINAGSGTTYFDNSGILEQTVTFGTTTIGVTFTNHGTVSVNTGTLQFSAGGSSSFAGNEMGVAHGAGLVFGGGATSPTFVLSGTLIYGGGVTLVSGSTLEIAENSIIGSSFELLGGTLDLSGPLGNDLTLTGKTIISDGTIIGSNLLFAQGVTTISGLTIGGGYFYDEGPVTENGPSTTVGVPAGSQAGIIIRPTGPGTSPTTAGSCSAVARPRRSSTTTASSRRPGAGIMAVRARSARRSITTGRFSCPPARSTSIRPWSQRERTRSPAPRPWSSIRRSGAGTRSATRISTSRAAAARSPSSIRRNSMARFPTSRKATRSTS